MECQIKVASNGQILMIKSPYYNTLSISVKPFIPIVEAVKHCLITFVIYLMLNKNKEILSGDKFSINCNILYRIWARIFYRFYIDLVNENI